MRGGKDPGRYAGKERVGVEGEEGGVHPPRLSFEASFLPFLRCSCCSRPPWRM